MVLSEECIIKRLRTADTSQECIETLSAWVMHHKDSIEMIVESWLSIFRTANEDLRIALFYVMNHVVQKCHGKGHLKYYIPWQPVIISAITIGRSGERLRHSMERIIKIFEEKKVFPPKGLNSMKTKMTDEQDDFEAIETSELLTKVVSFENSHNLMQKGVQQLKSSKLSYSSFMHSKMKDRQEGSILLKDVNDSIKKIGNFINACEIRQQRTCELVELVEMCMRNFGKELKDVATIEDAYQKFYQGILEVRHEIQVMIKEGVYPGASPPRDAPSPTQNDDIYAHGVEEVLQAFRAPVRDNHDVTDMDVGEDDGIPEPIGPPVDVSRSILTPSTSVSNTGSSSVLDPRLEMNKIRDLLDQVNASRLKEKTISAPALSPLSKPLPIEPLELIAHPTLPPSYSPSMTSPRVAISSVQSQHMQPLLIPSVATSSSMVTTSKINAPPSWSGDYTVPPPNFSLDSSIAPAHSMQPMSGMVQFTHPAPEVSPSSFQGQYAHTHIGNAGNVILGTYSPPAPEPYNGPTGYTHVQSTRISPLTDTSHSQLSYAKVNDLSQQPSYPYSATTTGKDDYGPQNSRSGFEDEDLRSAAPYSEEQGNDCRVSYSDSHQQQGRNWNMDNTAYGSSTKRGFPNTSHVRDFSSSNSSGYSQFQRGRNGSDFSGGRGDFNNRGRNFHRGPNFPNRGGSVKTGPNSSFRGHRPSDSSRGFRGGRGQFQMNMRFRGGDQ